ncbi:sporulation protein [Melghirimyces profundicolus]|uniref:sporulation protein n=1 Tax=Melghirimyces profundicolus TaxID=1242148 RepID=UPI0014728CA1|nr:sporulation protein [Melghirimyces profundicolus]
MFKNLLAKMGKGGAKVDLKLEKTEFLPGDTVKGELVITGGMVEQRINGADVELQLVIRANGKPFSHTIETIPIRESFVIPPDNWRSFPFSCVLPKELPVSGNPVTYSFVTRLDIEGAVDHTDHDYIKVQPPDRLQKVLQALSRLGFREKYGSRSFNGYTQEFELFPTQLLHGKVEEVEFAAAVEEGGLRLLLEVDVHSWTGEKEIKRELFLENSLLDEEEQLKERLSQVLTEMAENPSSWQWSISGKHKHGSLHWKGMIGGFAAGVLGAMVLSELTEEAVEGLEEATDLDLPEGDFDLADGMFDD